MFFFFFPLPSVLYLTYLTLSIDDDLDLEIDIARTYENERDVTSVTWLGEDLAGRRKALRERCSGRRGYVKSRMGMLGGEGVTKWLNF